MLSTVLHSEKAIRVNIAIIRVFIELRKQPKAHQLDLAPKLESLENMFTQRFDRLEARFQSQATVAKGLTKHQPVAIIKNAVARRWGLRAQDLESASRAQAISLPRQIAIYLVRKQLYLGFSEIGRHFGQRDHTTILHAYHKIVNFSETNEMIRTVVDSVQKEIQPLL